MNVETELLVGLAGLLDAAGVGTYKPSGGYLATDTAIVFGDLPTGPNRAIALTIYASTDEIKQNLSAYRVQVRTRGNPNNSLDAGDLASVVFDTLQGIENVVLSANVFLVQCYRLSLIPMGIDATKRSERSDNYLVQVNTPQTAHRPG